MNHLITGGAGFIGSHLADALLARGDSVVALDDVSTGSLDNIRHLLDRDDFRLVEGSILDYGLVKELVASTDVVVHLAAAVGVKLIIAEPLRSLITNIRGTEIVLEATANAGRRILIASTSEVYGKNAFGALTEDADRILGSPFTSRWSYSVAKSVDEILAHAYYRERGTQAMVVRFFNCVGPRQTGAYGMVVPALVRQALTHADLTVYGSGEQQRCFCHVNDTVAGVLAVLDHPDSPGQPFNIGAPHEVTINELAERIVIATGSSSRVVHVPYEEAYEEGFEDMQRRVPDITRIRELTGWSPTRSLDDILADVIAFERGALEVG